MLTRKQCGTQTDLLREAGVEGSGPLCVVPMIEVSKGASGKHRERASGRH